MSRQAIYSDEVFQLLQKCLDLFLNNKFEESEKLVKEHSTWSVYSSVGYSLIWFIRSMMTFDKTDGNVALENLNQTVNLCSKFKKDQSAITSWWQGSKQYDNYTKDELHAELIAGLIETGLMTSCESNFFTKKMSKLRRSWSRRCCLSLTTTKFRPSYEVHLTSAHPTTSTNVAMNTGSFMSGNWTHISRRGSNSELAASTFSHLCCHRSTLNWWSWLVSVGTANWDLSCSRKVANRRAFVQCFVR